MFLNEDSILRSLTVENIRRGLPMLIGGLKRTFTKAPLATNYDITYNCNLRCEHCYFHRAVEEKRLQGKSLNDLTDEQWIKIFKYHRSMGVNSAALTGGEPTLRMNLLFEAKKIFDHVQITTNGIIKMPKFPRKQPVIWTSLDGRPETHNAIRGAEIFDRVIENIQDDKRIYIIFTVSSSNYNEISEIAKIAHDTNTAGLFYNFYTGYPKDPLLLKGKSLQKAVKELYKVMADYGEYILLSKKMIDTFINKSHVKDCFFKNGEMQSFFPNGKRKFCVMGNSPALCANCGCVVPIAAHCLKKFDPTTIEKFRKIPL
ncbi:MAG: radical SAM protein [Candidatus Helarchaeota archaeon]